MGDIKLTYFESKGRAEFARLILSYAGVKFIDERLTPEQFASIKSQLPYGQLPTLTYKGSVICQSITIARFLAAEFGLAGRTNLEAAQANETVDALGDILEKIVPVLFEPNQEKKAEDMKTLQEKTLPAGVGQLEKILSSRGGQFFAGNSLTWADISVFHFCHILQELAPQALSGAPGIADLYERVGQIPNIKNWVDSRPKTDH